MVFRVLTNSGGVWGGLKTSPSLIRFGGMYGKAAFFGSKRLRLWRKMNTCQSENSCHQALIFAFSSFVENPQFFNDLKHHVDRADMVFLV